MMPTKVTVRGRPVSGNETPDTALLYSSSEHISAHYKRILAVRDQEGAKNSASPRPSRRMDSQRLAVSTRFDILQAYARTFYSQITVWVLAKIIADISTCISCIFDRLVVWLLVLVPFVRGWRVVVRASRTADPTSATFSCLSAYCSNTRT
jgi:hypothetical protein